MKDPWRVARFRGLVVSFLVYPPNYKPSLDVRYKECRNLMRAIRAARKMGPGSEIWLDIHRRFKYDDGFTSVMSYIDPFLFYRPLEKNNESTNQD